MARPADFRRMVLPMGPGTVDRRMLRAAADFARLLELEMLGIFVEDPVVLGLADLPFMRELRLPDHAWHSFDSQRMAAELRAAANQARHLFDQESAAHGLVGNFEVRRGDPAAVPGALEGTDILVVGEPAAAGGGLTTAASQVQRAALRSPVTILLLPPSAVPRKGPIALLAAGTSDPAFVLASHVAAATGEELVRVSSSEGVSPAELVACFDRDLPTIRERLVVMPRRACGASDEMPLRLAAARNVPVLVIESRAPTEVPHQGGRS